MLVLLIYEEELRHLDFRKIGINCCYIQELDFKQNRMPMTPLMILTILIPIYYIRQNDINTDKKLQLEP